MTQPKISIIVPVFNVEPYITECIQSVMRQTYKGPMECIVVDDCGNDKSIEIVEMLIDEYDGLIEFKIMHHDNNRGLSAARNTGTDAASGDYVCYLDSDDFIEPNAIEKLFDAFSLYDNIAFTSILPYNYPQRGARDFVENWRHTNNEIKVVEADVFNLTFLKMEVCFTAFGKLFPKSLIKNVRFLEGRNNEDTRFFYDLAPIIEQRNLCVVELPDELYAYRVNDKGICSNKEKLSLEHLKNLREIRIETQDDRVRRFVAKKAFAIESAYIKEHHIDDESRWIEDDFRKYTLTEVWSYYHSIKKCVKYMVWKNRNLRKYYFRIVKVK